MTMLYTIFSIAPVCRKLHTVSRKLVLATGFFDLLHAEHINFLRHAKAAGDILLVAVESDERAKLLKGESRPIQTQELRCQKLLELQTTDSRQLVDYIIQLDPDFNNPVAFESLISAIRPAVLAVSSHTAHQDKKQALVSKYGGTLKVVHNHNPEISTTKLTRKTGI